MYPAHWTPADIEDFEERAAIMEYEAGMPRDRAECLAAADVESRKALR